MWFSRGVRHERAPAIKLSNMSGDVSQSTSVKIAPKHLFVIGEENCAGTMLRPSCLASSLSKSLCSVPSLQFLDANSFADVLGVSPAFRQKETLRWNSALQLYKQMSTQDLSKLNDDNSTYDAAAAFRDESDENDGPIINRFIDVTTKTNDPLMRSSASFNADAHDQFIQQQQIEHHRRFGVVTPPRRSVVGGGSEHKRSGGTSNMTSPGEYGESSLNSLELEAIAAVHELQFAVKDIFVSELLPRTSELIFLNVTTLEGQAYCVELTMKGWRVTSLRHDCMNGDFNHIELHTRYFETIYALMDNISPSYRDRFSEAVSAKLRALEVSESDGLKLLHGEVVGLMSGAKQHLPQRTDRFQQNAYDVLEDFDYEGNPIVVNVKHASVDDIDDSCQIIL